MINYRRNKVCYSPNALGSLYIDQEKVNADCQPIIYIGGQMEHRMHMTELNGYTSDSNHNAYSGSWMYEYSIFSKDKNDINARAFSDNLIAALEEAKLRDVILVGFSHGGLIASYASKSDIVDKVICMHAPVLGTPLANPNELEKYATLLTKKQRLLLKALKLMVDYDYGFQKDNFKGLNLGEVDLHKLLVVGSCLDKEREDFKLVVETYDLIYRVCGCQSDGVIFLNQRNLNSWALIIINIQMTIIILKRVIKNTSKVR